MKYILLRIVVLRVTLTIDVIYRKDTRNVSVSITVQVIAAVPPIMEIGKLVKKYHDPDS